MCEQTDLVVKIWWWPLGNIHLPTITHKDLKLRNQNLPDIWMYDEILYRHVSWKIRDPIFDWQDTAYSSPLKFDSFFTSCHIRITSPSLNMWLRRCLHDTWRPLRLGIRRPADVRDLGRKFWVWLFRGHQSLCELATISDSSKISDDRVDRKKNVVFWIKIRLCFFGVVGAKFWGLLG